MHLDRSKGMCGTQTIHPFTLSGKRSRETVVPLYWREARPASQKEGQAMNGPAQYLHVGFLLISLANLLVIVLLIVVFVLAAALRRPEKQRLSTIEAGVHPGRIAGDEAM